MGSSGGRGTVWGRRRGRGITQVPDVAMTAFNSSTVVLMVGELYVPASHERHRIGVRVRVDCEPEPWGREINSSVLELGLGP